MCVCIHALCEHVFVFECVRTCLWSICVLCVSVVCECVVCECVVCECVCVLCVSVYVHACGACVCCV